MKQLSSLILTFVLLTTLSGCVVHPTHKAARLKVVKPAAVVVVDKTPSAYVVVKTRIPNKVCVKNGAYWRCKR